MDNETSRFKGAVAVAIPITAIAACGLSLYTAFQLAGTQYSDSSEFSGAFLKELSEQAAEFEVDVPAVDENLQRLTAFCAALSSTLENDLLAKGLDINPVVEFDDRYSDCDVKVDGLHRLRIDASDLNDDGTIEPRYNSGDYAPADYIETLLANKPIVAEFCQSFENAVLPSLRRAGVEADIDVALFQGYLEDACDIEVNGKFTAIITPSNIAPDGKISEYAISNMAERLLENVSEDERKAIEEVLPQLLP